MAEPRILQPVPRSGRPSRLRRRKCHPRRVYESEALVYGRKPRSRKYFLIMLYHVKSNALQCSYEAGILENPDTTPPADMWKLTIDPLKAPDKPEHFTVEFTQGIPTQLEYIANGENKAVTEPVELFTTANAIARRNGVGRIDIMENRYIGIKSRGCYETPGLSMLRAAHIDLEGLVLDREVRALRDQFVTISYGRILYYGLYFSPEREFLHASIIKSQENVNGRVRCMVYKGGFWIEGRSAKGSSLYDMSESSMDELGGFQPSDASVSSQATSPQATSPQEAILTLESLQGFIAVNAIRLKKYGKMKQEAGETM